MTHTPVSTRRRSRPAPRRRLTRTAGVALPFLAGFAVAGVALTYVSPVGPLGRPGPGSLSAGTRLTPTPSPPALPSVTRPTGSPTSSTPGGAITSGVAALVPSPGLAEGGPPALGLAGGSTGVHLDGDGIEDLAIGALGHLVLRLSGRSQPRVVPLTPDFSADVMAVGDFDGDGLDDVAVADPWAVVSDAPGAGTVMVVPSREGEGEPAVLRLDEEVSGVPDNAERGDHFGSSLAAADFDGDGYDDLAVGVPGESDDATGATTAGMVLLVPGGAGGLDPARTRALVPNVAGVAERPARDDRLGTAVAAGDVTGEGRPDLVVTAPGDRSGTLPGGPGGAVFVLPGTSVGPTGAGASVVRGTGMADGEVFDGALTVGDVTGDGRGDVVVGSSGTGCGRVDVLAGTDRGIEATAVWSVDQDTRGVPDSCEDGEFWGRTLATGDVDGDGRADVVVGNPQERVGGHPEAGACTVLPGTPSGITGRGAYLVTQDAPGVSGSARDGNWFGDSLVLRDLDGDGGLDLVVGAPHHRDGDVMAGQVTGVGGATRLADDGKAESVFHTVATELSTGGAPLWMLGGSLG